MDWPRLDRQSVVPLYYQIQQGLLERIRSGKWKAGKPIPSEEDLSRKLRVSRMTARQALKGLCSLGVAYSQRGKGTFVSGIKQEKNIRQVLSFTQEMAARGERASAKLVHSGIRKASGEVAEALHLRAKEDVNVVQRVRLADSVAMGIETAYLPVSRFPDLLQNFDPRSSLYETLARFYGVQIVMADEVVEAGLASAEQSRLMRIAKGSPVFVFTRRSHAANGEPVEFVKSVFRGDRYKLVSRLKRSTEPMKGRVKQV